MSALEWRYKHRDDATGQLVQYDWRPRPEGVNIHQLYDEAQRAHADSKFAPFGVESRPVQTPST